MNAKDLEFALGPLSRMGLSDSILDIYFSQSNKLENIEYIDDSIKNYDLSDNNYKGEILIPFVHSAAQTDYLLGFLGHTFRCRGYRPLFVSCRGTLPMCFRKQAHPDNNGTCVGCKYRSDEILGAYGFETVSISNFGRSPETIQLPDDREKLRNFEYEGVNVADLAIASARKHLRKYNIDLATRDDRSIFERYLRSGIYFVDFSINVLNEREIVATIGNHPAYVYGGAVLEATAEFGLPAISFGGGYFRDDALLFGNMKNRMGFEHFSDSETLRDIVELELDPDERKKTEYYMSGRRDGSTIREINQYIQDTKDGFSLDTHAITACLFTNLLWDGSLSGAAFTFGDPLEWVKETVNYIRGLNNFRLIIKPHPAEAHRETKIQMENWVESELNVPENVHILEADTDISPYEIFEEIDFSMVYNSTVGLESAYDGVPVITAGDTHYKNLGFTYDPKTPNEYFDLLDHASDIELTEENQRRAIRYAHFLLVNRHISLDGLDSIEEIQTISHETIAENDVLDSVVEQILADERSIRVS